MTTVTGVSADRMLEIEAASVVDGEIDASGHLILTKHNGETIDAGAIPSTTPVPSYAGVRTGSYDPDLNLYVPRDGRLGKFRNRVHAARFGRSTTIAIVGSSTVAGSGATTVNLGWAHRMSQLMEDNLYYKFGTGLRFVGCAKMTSDSRWTFSATGVTAPLTLEATLANAAWAETVLDQWTERVKVWYFDNGGPFTIKVDAAAPVTITPTGTNAMLSWTSGLLTWATHTVRVTATTATPAVVSAIEGYMNSGGGMSVTPAGVGVTGTSFWAANTWNSPINQVLKRSPALMIIAANGNDFTLGVDRETTGANLTTAIGICRYFNTEPLLLAMPVTNSADKAAYDAHMSVLYDVADETSTALIDMNDRWGPYSEISGAGFSADGVHPSDRGHEIYAHAVLNVVGWMPK